MSHLYIPAHKQSDQQRVIINRTVIARVSLSMKIVSYSFYNIMLKKEYNSLDLIQSRSMTGIKDRL